MGGTDRSGQPVDEIARLRDAFASASAHAHPGADCPGPEQLWAAVTGELPTRLRRKLVDHVSTCPACAEAWRLARELAPAAEFGGAAEPWTGRLASILGLPWSWNRAVLAGAAAAVVLSAAVTVRFMAPGPAAPLEPTPPYRNPNLVRIQSLLPPGEPLSREQPLLRWSAGPEGSEYAVTVTTEDLRQVVSVRALKAAQLRIPTARLAGLPPGTKLLWQVETRLPDAELIRSGTFIVPLQ